MNLQPESRVSRLVLASGASFPLYHFDTVPSTQDQAWRLAAGGAPPNTLVLAARQTAGRGRRLRDWQSPRGGLWVSLLLYPVDAGPAGLVVFRAAQALAGACVFSGLPRPRLKLPNDLYFGSRKAAGVLAERRAAALVLGVGVNVNCRAGRLSCPAVSLREICGRRVDRGRLLRDFLHLLDPAALVDSRGFLG